MGDDDARALVRRWWHDIWGDGNLDAVDELCTDPYIRHTSLGTEHISRAEYKKRLGQTMHVLRGAQTTIDDEVVVDDKVWTRATSRGVNLTTEDRQVMTWIVVHRIEGGRIAETWAATLPGVDWEA